MQLRQQTTIISVEKHRNSLCEGDPLLEFHLCASRLGIRLYIESIEFFARWSSVCMIDIVIHCSSSSMEIIRARLIRGC